MTDRQPERSRGLSYPYGRKAAPEPDHPQEIAPGVYWARFAMPMSLDHINIWLLEDGEGWTVVDTCLDLPESRAHWERLFAGFMGGRPVTRVICTHMHPDHVGLAGWLVERFDCDLWISREEFLMCRAMVADTGQSAPEPALRFYHRAGYNEEQLERYCQKFGNFGTSVFPLPHTYRRLVDGETLRINNHYWQVVVGAGHSPEHVCLYCPSFKLLISGDQILPRISSNVSVFPTEPEGNPLQEWLTSCERIRQKLPDDLLVLPAHEFPFHGLHIRLTQLIESHKRELDHLYDHLSESRRVVDCFSALFKRKIDNHTLGLATGETVAHLNCLLNRRQATRTFDENGVAWYLQKPEAVDFD